MWDYGGLAGSLCYYVVTLWCESGLSLRMVCLDSSMWMGKGLVTNYGKGGGLQNGGGGYKTGGGGACEVLPLRKGWGGEKSSSHAEGGGGAHNIWGSFLRSSLKF